MLSCVMRCQRSHAVPPAGHPQRGELQCSHHRLRHSVGQAKGAQVAQVRATREVNHRRPEYACLDVLMYLVPALFMSEFESLIA